MVSGESMEVERSVPERPERPAGGDGKFPEERVPGGTPVGSGDHVVKEGECISSLAAQAGLRLLDIWENPANAVLHDTRQNPNVLLPRDRVAIRTLELKQEDRPTDNRARFQLDSEPVFLQIQVLRRDIPLAGRPFTLKVDGLTIDDVVPADGIIKAQIPATATSGSLRVGRGASLFNLQLKLGALHPVESDTGVQQRLLNLGFDCGPIDGHIGPRTRAAIRVFQEKFGLQIDGIAGPQTRNRLKQEHGC